MEQLHKITAHQLNIKPSKNGFFYCNENKKISIKDHNRILATMQSELKAHFIDLLEQHKNDIESIKQITLI